MQVINVETRNPFNTSRDKLIDRIEQAARSMRDRKTGCEVHDIITACSALIHMGEGAACCAFVHNIRTVLEDSASERR